MITFEEWLETVPFWAKHKNEDEKTLMKYTWSSAQMEITDYLYEKMEKTTKYLLEAVEPLERVEECDLRKVTRKITDHELDDPRRGQAEAINRTERYTR